MANIIEEPKAIIEERKHDEERLANANPEPSIGNKDAYKYNPEYHQMADFLGLSTDDKMNSAIAEKVAYLRDFTKAKDNLDAMVEVKNMIQRLGLVNKGKELVITLYKYARLHADRERIEKEMSLLINTNEL